MKIAELQQTLTVRDARILELEGMLSDLENQQTELTNDLNRYACLSTHLVYPSLVFVSVFSLSLSVCVCVVVCECVFSSPLLFEPPLSVKPLRRRAHERFAHTSQCQRSCARTPQRERKRSSSLRASTIHHVIGFSFLHPSGACNFLRSASFRFFLSYSRNTSSLCRVC